MRRARPPRSVPASTVVPRSCPSNPGPRSDPLITLLAQCTTADHVKALDREGQLLVAAARSAGVHAASRAARVGRCGTCLAHIGFVHRWAARYVAEGLTEMVEEPGEAPLLSAAPPDDLILSWVADGHAALVEVLSSAPPDVQCWTFLAAPSPLAFWARRQAHETAVHRVDCRTGGRRPANPI